MIEIRTDGKALDLPTGFSIEIEDSSPIYNDRGSQSVPATVPATRLNTRLLNAPHRIDAGDDPNMPEKVVEVIQGAYQRRGTLNITEASRNEGITFNIGFDNSTAYARWQKKKLAELTRLPVWRHDPNEQATAVEQALDYLYRIYQHPNPQNDDFAVFPLAVNNESTGSDENKSIYWEVFNVVGNRGLYQPHSVHRLIDGKDTLVTIPEGYGVSPFLRVWRIIELVFSDLDLVITGGNPFKDNLELSRLVVLNNAADAVCPGYIKYSDLMPDSTVEEFLNALWVRFGFVYSINYDEGTVCLKLLKDIITGGRSGEDLADYCTGPEKITFEKHQYLKLRAATSLEGAAPSHERFEDFVRGLDVSHVRLGAHVSVWQNTGTQDDPRWDGDDSYYDWVDDYDPDEPWEPEEPDWPEPDDDRDDGRDDDRDDDRDYDSRSYAPARSSSTTAQKTDGVFLAREYITGTWYRLDATNGEVRLSSSGFFDWNPEPEGLDPLELSSDDEFVPIQRVSTVKVNTGHMFNDHCPLYLVGARHYHSYIKGSEETDNTGDETPLAFLFAYTKGSKTIGRLNGEGGDGMRMTLDDGTTPTLSLLFQFKDGLFAKFWADYDEILRHGNRVVEVNTRLNKLDLHRLDILDIVRFKNVRCLIDTLTYTLPAPRSVSVDMKLRTIQTQGKYDIKREQGVPDFSAATRHLEWRLYSETYDQKTLDTVAAKREAVDNYIDTHDYQPHGSQGDEYYLGVAGAFCRGISRYGKTWQTDPDNTPPTAYGQRKVRTYKALLEYDIYEIHDMGDQDNEDWELDELPLGSGFAVVEYTVNLYAHWVAD